MKIETIKKINKIYDTFEDKIKKNIDKFDFAYVHIIGIDIIGVHLIKKDKNLNNYIQVFSSINEFSHIIGKYSLQYLTHNLTNRGNIVVAIDMSGYVTNEHNKIIDFVLKN
jgi:hypothetical protein